MKRSLLFLAAIVAVCLHGKCQAPPSCGGGVPTTTNLGLCAPTNGTANWGVMMNANAAALDYLLSGHAQLPAAFYQSVTQLVNWRGAWAATTAYAVGDAYSNSGTLYRVSTAYSSGATFGSSDTSNTFVYGVTGGGGGGSISSIAITVPSIFTISPLPSSPCTSGSCAFTISLNTASANRVFAGPSSGSAATPGFRLLVFADLPALSADQYYGAITTGPASALNLPSCAGTNQALTYTLGTGFGCVTISGGGGGSGTVSNGGSYALSGYGSASSTTVGPLGILSDSSKNDLYIPGFVQGMGTQNGARNYAYTGLAATAPGAHTYQESPNVDITTPWSRSPAPAPATGLPCGLLSGAIWQEGFVAPSTAGYVLVDQGAGVCPIFQAPISVDASNVAAPKLSSSTPAAPGGNTNVTWQKDGSGHVSAYVPTATGGGCMTQMQVVVSSAVSSVTFSSIPATCTDLELTYSGASSTGSAEDDVRAQINTDTGSNYDWTYNTSQSSGGFSGGNSQSQTDLLVGAFGNSSAPGRAQMKCNFDDYVGTVFYKSSDCQGVTWISGTNFNQNNFMGGDWKSTSAITSIKLFLHSGSNFVTGSTFTLRGK